MKAYSKEFRRDVLAACDARGGTREVALRFDVSESWPRWVKQERSEQSKLAPSTTRNLRKSWEPYDEWLLAKLHARPDISLRELRSYRAIKKPRSCNPWASLICLCSQFLSRGL